MNNPYADCITFTENEITLRSLDHPLELSHPYYVFNGDVEKSLLYSKRRALMKAEKADS